MTDQDPRVIDNMDKWADRLSELFEKEAIHVPKSVVALACIRLLERSVKASDVLTEAAAIQLVKNVFESNTESLYTDAVN